ncbi:MAG: hypothetical protein LBD28_04055 [Tannerellaceae bacterium]|jgi:hypothetical protein|nr:hypothetical protein [Tannerellaceae bacterium]
MKNLLLSGCFAASLIVLTSCLGGGSEIHTASGMPGVIRMDAKSGKMLIDAPYFAPYGFYAAGLSNSGFFPDDCILFSFSVDLGDPENADVATKEYYTGSLADIAIVDQYSCLGSMMDSTVLLNNEQKVAYAVDANYGSNGGYAIIISNKLFLFSDMTMMSGQQNQWVLYCDASNLEPIKDSSTSLNVYSFYLRSILSVPGKAPETNSIVVNAFEMGSVLNMIQNREKQGSQSEAILRINFVKDIKDEGETLVWDKSDLRIVIARES